MFDPTQTLHTRTHSRSGSLEVFPFEYETPGGVRYFKHPGVILFARTICYPDNLTPFLEQYDPTFRGWAEGADKVSPGAMTAKGAGQLCYLSFGEGATPHSDTEGYLKNIKLSRHGSVIEHANISLLLWGIDRAVTHEIVRHRAGFGFSQVSQRYVNRPRFVLSPEYDTPELFADFCQNVEGAMERYERRANLLMAKKPLPEGATRKERVEYRKAVNSAARRVLPNETEAPLVVTANLRGWRHFIEQRHSRWADLGIQIPAGCVLDVLRDAEPEVFGDYQPDDFGGSKTEYVKV